ncbi:hypothetical protein AA148_16565 [Salmonella enterica subsp. enterica serovar Muenchen]|uniref:hypothetical protein n=1 Tax=Salmonella enterica TaxID=28901 RepID=UPI0008FCA628|nr:hypothetical protein [Salmonella enterica]EAU5117764.1 hypothetical protein [Salmonella enterica subsp. enterica serovar Montevideo]EBL6309743.1 hypothetical protein [Salmonella enterica subsp. enterica serovar Rubislaw]ECH9424787.1 hypothetical protein [Salmonella enterica subsp. enterica serovar Javiana]ECO0665906.1 hypothetical protein [Salmonella enterica subsp. enterica serovar Give]ECX5675769.1 hypothetical protein [Salmonella enterica subsp. enterica serovar Newport]EDV3151448.1 hyp
MGESDENLAPMVDGLSSGLCMLILVATVFMINSIDTTVAVHSEPFRFYKSQMISNIIYYNDAIDVDPDEFEMIARSINSEEGGEVIVIGYQKDLSLNKLLYNFTVFQNGLGDINKKISYKQAKENICGRDVSCLIWEVD